MRLSVKRVQAERKWFQRHGSKEPAAEDSPSGKVLQSSGAYHNPHPALRWIQSTVLVASRSIAITDSSRCSSRVSSILLWLMPLSDCTNIMTVGMPARATSAASCRGPEGRRWLRPAVSSIACVAQIDQRRMERHRLDVPDPRPFHRAALFGGETFAGFARLTKHLGKHGGVEIALIERGFAAADHGGDDPGKRLHAAHGADGVGMLAGDGADLERQLRGRRPAHRAAHSSAWSRSAPPGRGT